jgi:uncharacterized C2H2 Zn-finger protein
MSKVGKTMLLLKCPSCDKLFSKEKNKTHVIKKGWYTTCSKTCRGKFSRKIQLFGKTHEMNIAISENIVREFNSLDNAEETFTKVP